MKCPMCATESVVLDSRPSEDGAAVMRRRSCTCGARWTTTEIKTGNVKMSYLPNWKSPGKPQQVVTGSAVSNTERPPPIVVEASGEKPQQVVKTTTGCGLGGEGVGLDPSLLPGLDQEIRISSSRSTEVVRKRRKIAASEVFERWWALYPRKVKRKKAIEAWVAGELDGKAEVVIAGLQAQLAFFRSCPMDKVPHPTSWLNAERWTDDPGAYVNARPGVNGAPTYAEKRDAANNAALAAALASVRM